MRLCWLIFLAVSFQISAADDDACSKTEFWGAQGEDLKICCVTSKSGSDYVHHWTRVNHGKLSDNTLLARAGRYSVSRDGEHMWWLTIKALSSGDRGVYQCQTDTRGGKTGSVKNYRLITVNVGIPAEITWHGDPVLRRHVGDDVSLECPADGVPSPTITWYRARSSGEKELLPLTGPYVTLSSITLESSGNYICEASNNFGKGDARMFYISALSVPELHVAMKHMEVRLHGTVMAYCHAMSAAPLNDFYFQHKGRRITKDTPGYAVEQTDLFDKETVLMMHVAVTEQSFGEYECVAENEQGDSRDTMKIEETLGGNAWVSHPPVNMTLMEGDMYRVNCQLEDLIHTDWVSWWWKSPKYGTQRLYTTNIELTPTSGQAYAPKAYILANNALIIKRVTMEDYGQFICELNGQRNYSASLTVVTLPECSHRAPMNSHNGQVNFTCTATHHGDNTEFHVELAYMEEPRYIDPNLITIRDGPSTIDRLVTFPRTMQSWGWYTCRIFTFPEQFQASCKTKVDFPGSYRGRVFDSKAPRFGLSSKAMDLEEGAWTSVEYMPGLMVGLVAFLIVALAAVSTAFALHWERHKKKTGCDTRSTDSCRELASAGPEEARVARHRNLT